MEHDDYERWRNEYAFYARHFPDIENPAFLLFKATSDQYGVAFMNCTDWMNFLAANDDETPVFIDEKP